MKGQEPLFELPAASPASVTRQIEGPACNVWLCAQTPAQQQRQGRYTRDSNKHPAKMLPELARLIIATYSRPGDLVLDPMAGIGTTVVEAGHMGRRGFGVEYEPKFVELAQANLELARSQGAGGQMLVVQGDARQLSAVLANADLMAFSPPYGAAQTGGGIARSGYSGAQGDDPGLAQRAYKPDTAAPGGIDLLATSPVYGNRAGDSGRDMDARLRRMAGTGNVRWERAARNRSPGAMGMIEFDYSSDARNLANLDYGDINLIATSPPYANSAHDPGNLEAMRQKVEERYPGHVGPDSLRGGTEYSADPANIGNLPRGRPFEPHTGGTAPDYAGGTDGVARSKQDYLAQDGAGNITRAPTYLSEMARVYAECFQVLKAGGFMAVVTRDFRRDGQLVNLAGDTITLCLRQGFVYYQHVIALLCAMDPIGVKPGSLDWEMDTTNRASFWQLVQVPRARAAGQPILFVQHEDVLVFQKPDGQLLKKRSRRTGKTKGGQSA